MNKRWLNNSLARGQYFILCITEKQYLRACKECGIERPTVWLRDCDQACVHFMTNKEGQRSAIVCLDDSGLSLLDIAVYLTHETTHLWQNHCEHIGEDAPGTEVEAYAIQNILEVLLDSYLKMVPKAKGYLEYKPNPKKVSTGMIELTDQSAEIITDAVQTKEDV
jgi:hypothetical protein